MKGIYLQLLFKGTNDPLIPLLSPFLLHITYRFRGLIGLLKLYDYTSHSNLYPAI